MPNVSHTSTGRIVSLVEQTIVTVILGDDSPAVNREPDFDLDPSDDPERVQWAYNEARKLLKENEGTFEALRQRLESGGATVGDCVAVIERSPR